MSAHGKHTANPGWDSGDNWVVCDICGFDIKASDIKKTWDNLLVCPDDYNPRHEQDFVRARKDKIAATIVRSEQEDVEISVTYSNLGADDTIPAGTFNPNTL